MPPQKPSPHRFIPQTPKPKPKSPSNLRHALTHTPTPTAVSARPDTQASKATPARRFVVAPLQASVREKEIWVGVGGERGGETGDTPRAKARRVLERVESIEEASQSQSQSQSQSSPSREVWEEGEEAEGVLQTIEWGDPFGDNGGEEGDGKTAPRGNSDEYAHDDEEMLFPSISRAKRRRTSSPPAQHNPAPSESPAPAPHHAPYRFRFPTATSNTTTAVANNANTSFASLTTTTTTTTTPHHRPTFLLPPQPTSPPAPSLPLPDIFSPSRKKGKYIASGLAATVAGWVVEAAAMAQTPPQTSTQTQTRATGTGTAWGRKREQEEGVRLRVRIQRLGNGHGNGNRVSSVNTVTKTTAEGDAEVGEQEQKQEHDCHPGTLLFARASTDPGLYNASRTSAGGNRFAEPTEDEDEYGVWVLLAGQGGARGTRSGGSGGVKVKVGSVIGIRAPTWEVDVAGRRWTVGVDWAVL